MHTGKSVSEIASKAPNRSGTDTNYGGSSSGTTSGTGNQQGGGSGTEGGNHGNNPSGGNTPGGEENPGGGNTPGEGENPGGDNPSNPQDKEKTKASITKAEPEKYYVEKGQNLKIKYTVNSNKQEGLKGITLDNSTFCPIESQNEDGTYTVSIPVASNSQGGKAIIKPIAVMYEFDDESETVILDETKEIEYYVLKDRPSIENYTFNEFVKDQILKMQ